MAHSFLARIFSDMKERIEFFLAGEQVDSGSALGGEACCWAWGSRKRGSCGSRGSLRGLGGGGSTGGGGDGEAGCRGRGSSVRCRPSPFFGD